MMRSFVLPAVALAAAATLGCAPEATMPSDAGATVTYTKDVQPIFLAKCADCHTTMGQGQHNIATTYADVMKPVQSLDAPAGCFKDTAKTMPKTMGECALAAIMDGWMPMAMGCFNTPRPTPCVTLAEQDVIAAWVAAGMPK